MDNLLDQFTLAAEPLDDRGWAYLQQLLPPDREQSARKYGAFLLPNKIPDADTLLRLMLAYACGPSLRDVATRAHELQLIERIAVPSLSERLQQMTPWLSYLLGQLLADRQAAFPWGKPLHLRLLDATTIPRPGATQPDWRLHLGLNLQTGLIDHLSATGDNIGERLADFPVDAGDVVIADRGYATRAGIHALQARDAWVLVRMNWQNLPLQHPDGAAFDLLATLETLAPGTQGSWDVSTAPTNTLTAVRGRLVVQALPEAVAADARRRVRKAAKGKTPSAATLMAAGFVLVFTTVPAELLSPAEILALYRMRWQVEITFKRSKSALELAAIRAKTDQLCYAVILAKCILLLLVENFARAVGFFFPPGEVARPDESVSIVSGSLSDDTNAHIADPDAGRVALATDVMVDSLFYADHTQKADQPTTTD
jgi:hypothetical protein